MSTDMKALLEEVARLDVSRVDLLLKAVNTVALKIKADEVSLFQYKGFSPKDFLAALAKLYLKDTARFSDHTALVCLLFVMRGTKVAKIKSTISVEGAAKLQEIIDKSGLTDKIENKQTVTIPRWAAAFCTITATLMREHASSLTHEVCDVNLIPTWAATPSIICLFESRVFVPAVFRRVAFALCWVYNFYLSQYLKTVVKTPINAAEGQTAMILNASMKTGLIKGGLAAAEIVRLGFATKTSNKTRHWGLVRVFYKHEGVTSISACRLVGDDNLEYVLEKLQADYPRKFDELCRAVNALPFEDKPFVTAENLVCKVSNNWPYTTRKEAVTGNTGYMSRLFPNSDAEYNMAPPRSSKALPSTSGDGSLQTPLSPSATSHGGQGFSGFGGAPSRARSESQGSAYGGGLDMTKHADLSIGGAEGGVRRKKGGKKGKEMDRMSMTSHADSADDDEEEEEIEPEVDETGNPVKKNIEYEIQD